MKGKAGTPAWFWGLIALVVVFAGRDVFAFFNVHISGGTVALIVIMAIAAILFELYVNYRHRDEITRFFERVGLEKAEKIRREDGFNGYAVYLRLPVGKSLSDFARYKEALEQHLDSQVEMTYTNKSIKVWVSARKPDGSNQVKSI